MPDGPTIYNLDDYGILNLDNVKFEDSATEISLWDNKINDPHTITDNLINLPNLKALWLNGNPLQDNCHNFNQIGEFMTCLEIINSSFTSKASEWALIFCCKDQGVKSLEEITYLDVSARDVLKIKDVRIFEKLVNMKTIDFSEHKDLLKVKEISGDVEKEIEGQKFEETENNSTIDQLFQAIRHVENIICDQDIVEYLIELKVSGVLSEQFPNLISINKIPIQDNLESYKKEVEIKYCLEHLWKYACTYRFMAGLNTIDEENYWYMMDEVGSALQHSDVPNCVVHPFTYCPTGIMDEKTITYSIMWTLQDIKVNEVLNRDFLPGVTEEKFRSARLFVWFNTPMAYYEA